MELIIKSVISRWTYTFIFILWQSSLHPSRTWRLCVLHQTRHQWFLKNYQYDYGIPFSMAFGKTSLCCPRPRYARLSRQPPGCAEPFLIYQNYFSSTVFLTLLSVRSAPALTQRLFGIHTPVRGRARTGAELARASPDRPRRRLPIGPVVARQRWRLWRRGRRSPCRRGRCRCCSSTWAGRCSTSWTSASALRASPGRRPAKVSGGRPGPGLRRGLPAAGYRGLSLPCGASPCGLSLAECGAGAEQSAGTSLAMAGRPRGTGGAALPRLPVPVPVPRGRLSSRPPSRLFPKPGRVQCPPKRPAAHACGAGFLNVVQE